MARYGRDFDRGQRGMRSRGGMDRGFGGMGGMGYDDEIGGSFRGRGGTEGYGGFYGGGSEGWGGLRSDSRDFGYGGYSGFGSEYDRDYTNEGIMNRGYPGGLGGRGGMYGGTSGFGDRLLGGHGGGMWNEERGYGDTGYGGFGGGYGRTYDQGGLNRGGVQRGTNLRGQLDELRRMRAADIMTENPETVTTEASLADAARKMRDLNVGIIPVVDSDQNRRLRGVITDRDIAVRAVAEGRNIDSTKVMEVMTTEVESCNKNDTVHNILNIMEREQVRRVPITDREGRLVGIVAQADVIVDVESEPALRRVADAVERISEPAEPSRRQGGLLGRGRTGGSRENTINRGGSSSRTNLSGERGSQSRGNEE